MKRIYIAISLALLTIACNNPEPNTNNAPSVPESAPPAEDKGQALFEAKCAMCHGDDGTAGIGNAANLKLSILDTTAIVHILQKGKNNMPSFKDRLSDTEMKMVAHYVYALHK